MGKDIPNHYWGKSGVEEFFDSNQTLEKLSFKPHPHEGLLKPQSSGENYYIIRLPLLLVRRGLG
ncbi:MAG TPA: hypothetical protein PKV16_06935 [Caldisericia bacterium]|nr:hypothetical protein [Caldisericia bacterium]HPF49502.1 hypothetical protein [Caldisericia bacterium]HPI84204.1 hypothetical protein [Caldisericia bacterium]HPQ93501.1 hypothetical protein [Caldisericia bacterium]HRV75493.1 hypothetical protein [Caldisericia bacterium]